MGNQTSFETEKKALNQSVNKVKNVLSPLTPRRKTTTHHANTGSSRRKVFTPAPVETPKFQPWLPEVQNDHNNNYHFNDFVIHDNECLGEGSFACVKLATHAPTKKIAAVKVITKSKIPSEMRKYAINEPKYLRCLSHQNIIGHYLTHEDAEHIYMFLEYSKGGDLYSLVESKGHLSEDFTRKIMKQLISSLEFCQQNNICHRDIKLENVLYSSDESNIKIKLIDFGFASIIPCEEYLFQDFPGSMLYAAPELLEGTPYNARKSDVYSLGVLFYIMLYGRYPFFSESNVELLDLIQTTKPEFENKFSAQSTELIMKMLRCDPEERINLKDVLNHPWFNRESRKDVILSPLKTKANMIKTEVAKHSQNLKRYSLSPKVARRNK